MVNNVNSTQQIINQDYSVSTDKSSTFHLLKSESIKATDSAEVSKKYPGVTMSLQTLDKIAEESRLGAIHAPKATSFKPVFNKAKGLVSELIEKTRKIDKEDVAIEAGMQIKDWYDSNKIVSA